MIFKDGIFLIRKPQDHPDSIQNPWLGMMGEREVFGKIIDFISLTEEYKTRLKIFLTPMQAFKHIIRKYPQDVGKMRVYRATENVDGIHLEEVPWPTGEPLMLEESTVVIR